MYLNPTFNYIPLPSINGKAKILSQKVYNERYPNGVNKKSKEYGKVFICRRACNPRTAIYTEELDWDDLYKGRDTDIDYIIDFIPQRLKELRFEMLEEKKKPAKEEDYVYTGGSDNERDFVDGIPQTPKKRRKLATARTPSRATPKKTPSKSYLTPQNKRILVKAPLEFTPLALRTVSTPTAATPFSLARSKLHVSAIPDSLPCREAEFSEVYTYLSAAISEGTGSCIYISGTPGTGKTATVREVVTQLHAAVQAEELEDFVFVEINGMRVADPHHSYSLLWEAIKGERVSANHALSLLQAEFSTPSPRRVPCVVLMDELDQLVTKNQGVMYNFFNWPSTPYSKLIVLAVANTMDLPERTLSNKISSRLGLTRITFPGYTHDQLMTIITSRLSGVPSNLVDPDAIQFAARKVAAVSGDARRALDICRRAVEIVEYANEQANGGFPQTPSRRAKHLGVAQKEAKVTIGVIKQAISESVSSPLQQFLKGLPVASKVFLAALLARMRRSGLSENLLADVLDEAERMIKISTSSATLFDRGGGEKGLLALLIDEKDGIRGMYSSVLALAESGVVAVEGRKGERGGRVRLNVADEEIKGALAGDSDVGSLIGRS